MTEQSYHLFAIKTADLPQDGLKAHRYSYNANGRYCLTLSAEDLQPPFHKLPDNVQLTADEREWKEECEQNIVAEKMRKNVEYMREHEDEYGELLNSFIDRLSEELEKEKQSQGGKNDSKSKKST